MWFSTLSKAGGLLVISAVLVACTVVDLDENGKPILPVDPNAVVSDYNQPSDKVASTIWVSKVMPFANSNALSNGIRLRKQLCYKKLSSGGSY